MQFNANFFGCDVNDFCVGKKKTFHKSFKFITHFVLNLRKKKSARNSFAHKKVLRPRLCCCCFGARCNSARPGAVTLRNRKQKGAEAGARQNFCCATKPWLCQHLKTPQDTSRQSQQWPCKIECFMKITILSLKVFFFLDNIRMMFAQF